MRSILLFWGFVRFVMMLSSVDFFELFGLSSLSFLLVFNESVIFDRIVCLLII